MAGRGFAMRDGVLPPTRNVEASDPDCDLDYVCDVGRKADVEYAVAKCIAFGSKNSALVLRRPYEALQRTAPGAEPGAHPFP